MIADELAMAVSAEYVTSGTRVLDPFCGTGRTLVAAAEKGGLAVGLDVNPLAVLVSLAKAANPRERVLKRLHTDLLKEIGSVESVDYEFERGRTVQWFSSKAKRQLSSLLSYLNSLELAPPELAVVSAVLSATARDVSFCRKDQWKLHRMSAPERSAFRPCAWRIFAGRLNYVIDEICRNSPFQGRCRALLADSRIIARHLQNYDPFDLVFTSPPYGDSQTTVQYGGISSLCLGVIRHLNRLPVEISTRNIENACLGGDTHQQPILPFALKRYWCGADVSDATARSAAFLNDLFTCCGSFSPKIKKGGHAVFVVARRTVGGDQLKLDKFVRETMCGLGFDLKTCRKRIIAGKMTPYRIHRCGNTTKSRCSSSAYVSTMREEYVLVLKKTSSP